MTGNRKKLTVITWLYLLQIHAIKMISSKVQSFSPSPHFQKVSLFSLRNESSWNPCEPEKNAHRALRRLICSAKQKFILASFESNLIFYKGISFRMTSFFSQTKKKKKIFIIFSFDWRPGFLCIVWSETSGSAVVTSKWKEIVGRGFLIRANEN